MNPTTCRRRRQESLPFSPAAFIVMVLSFVLAQTTLAQPPDLSQGREIWRGDVRGREARVVQIPKNATALIPMRFILEEVNVTGHPGPSLAELLTRAELRAIGGAEATLSYAPTEAQVALWGDALIEVRETFRSPGNYQITFLSQADGPVSISVQVDVRPFRYLEFGEEFGLFVLGCLFLGGVFLAVILWMHRRTPRAMPFQSPVAADVSPLTSHVRAEEVGSDSRSPSAALLRRTGRMPRSMNSFLL